MSFCLEVDLRNSERALERLLGVASRRGYALRSIRAQLEPDGTSMSVHLELESDRPAERLVRQLAKLHEVMGVRRV